MPLKILALTTRRKVSIRKNRKLKGTTRSTGNSRFISLPRSPNLNRNVFQIRKKNQKMKQKCITTCSLTLPLEGWSTYPMTAKVIYCWELMLGVLRAPG